MATKMFEVQQKVFQRLNADINFTGKITGLYDFVPEKTTLPYATFGRIASTPLDTKVENGEVVSLVVDIWSEGKGRREVVSIMEALEMGLESELILESGTLISQRITNREVWEEVYGLFAGSIEIQFKIDWEE